VDDAFIPYQYEKMVPTMMLADYRNWASLRIDALNHALRGLPKDRTRYHICWGSWNGPHMFDVPIKDIVDLVLRVDVGAYSFEAANPRHEHEWKVWKDVRYADIVGRDSVMAGTDCGFSQSPLAGRVHRSIMWAKLKCLAEGAAIASKLLWH